MRSAVPIVVPLFLAMASSGPGAADIFARPVPAAGGDSRTLVVYDTVGKPFSLINEVAVVTTLLGRFQTRVDTRQAESVTVPEISAADYVMVLGVSGVPRLPNAVRRALSEGGRPVAYIGRAVALAGPGRGPVPEAQVLSDVRVTYAGGEWTASLDPFVVVNTVPADPLALVTAPAPRRYLAWRDGATFAFASWPAAGVVSLIFSDMLVDFYAVGPLPPPALVYLVQDFHPGCDAGAFRRLVDYFAARGDRFAVSVRLRPPASSGAAPGPEGPFFEALRYGQSHGGRVVLRPEVSAGQVRRLVDEGLVPLACELPAGSESPSRPFQGISFGTALGKIEAPGPKGAAQAVSASAVMPGPNQGLVIPLNVDPASASTRGRGVGAEVAELARLRGTMAGVVIPAWFPFQKMRDAVDEARRSGLRGADLAAAPNWISTDQTIITGPNVRRAFSVPGGSSTERVTFDRNFRRMAPGGGEAPMATAILLQQAR